MTKIEILNGNKLCANYIGAQFGDFFWKLPEEMVFDKTFDGSGFLITGPDKNWKTGDLCFHESLDWLEFVLVKLYKDPSVNKTSLNKTLAFALKLAAKTGASMAETLFKEIVFILEDEFDVSSTRAELIQKGLEYLHSVGYTKATKENIFVDEIYKIFFESALEDSKTGVKAYDKIVNDLLNELG